MFPLLHDQSTWHVGILPTSYNPVLEYYARLAAAPPCRRRPAWASARDRAGGPLGRSDAPGTPDRPGEAEPPSTARRANPGVS